MLPLVVLMVARSRLPLYLLLNLLPAWLRTEGVDLKTMKRLRRFRPSRGCRRARPAT